MIDICLATYNGEPFLKEQLDSILNQTYGKWHLWARDDGSSDRTTDILKEYQADHAGRISIIEDEKGNLGHARNFKEILKYTTASYIAFCDQDDIWESDKLTTLLAEMQSFGKTPALVHSDYSYVNEAGRVLINSHEQWIDDDIDRCNASIIRSFYMGVGVGCTMLMNRELLDLCLPVPDIRGKLDHWFLYGAILRGKVRYVRRQLVRHRVHGRNVSPKLNHRPGPGKKKVIRVDLVSEKENTARELLRVHQQELSSGDLALLRFHSQLSRKNMFNVLVFIFRSKLYYSRKKIYSLRILISMLAATIQRNEK